jgi:hypothetical protein
MTASFFMAAPSDRPGRLRRDVSCGFLCERKSEPVMWTTPLWYTRDRSRGKSRCVAHVARRREQPEMDEKGDEVG